MPISSNQLRAPSYTEGEYAELLARIRSAVGANVEPGSTVLVVNKGDDALLELDGRTGWHFPRDEHGHYPGFYPADSGAAVGHLEELRAKGAEYLLLPAPAFWWLEHYPQFAQHLDLNYELVARDDSTCLIFRLMQPEAERDLAPTSRDAHFTRQLRSFLDALLPLETSVLLVGTGDPRLGDLKGQRRSELLKVEPGLPIGPSGARYGSQIEYLEQRHCAGAEFLVVRGAEDEDHRDYEAYQEEVAAHYRQVARHRRFCSVFNLGARLTEDHQPPAPPAIGRLAAGIRRAFGAGRSQDKGGSPDSA